MSVNVQDEEGNTPLHFAAEECDLDTVRELLSAGANPNIQNLEEDAPIHIAIFSLCSEVVLALLEGGANPNIQNIETDTALTLALSFLGPEENGTEADRNVLLLIIEYVLRFGADPNFINDFGYAPIHLAILLNDITLVNLLLQNGANPDLEDVDGNTPLHFAVYQNNVPILRLLLDRGAKQLQGIYQKTPLDFAIFYNFTEIIQILRSYQSQNQSQNSCNITQCLQKELILKPNCSSSFIVSNNVNNNNTNNINKSKKHCMSNRKRKILQHGCCKRKCSK